MRVVIEIWGMFWIVDSEEVDFLRFSFKNWNLMRCWVFSWIKDLIGENLKIVC